MVESILGNISHETVAVGNDEVQQFHFDEQDINVDQRSLRIVEHKSGKDSLAFQSG